VTPAVIGALAAAVISIVGAVANAWKSIQQDKQLSAHDTRIQAVESKTPTPPMMP
jgi:hypothetical protein